MKFTVDAKTLLAQLMECSTHTDRKDGVQSCVRIVAGKQGIELAASGLDGGYIGRAKAKVAVAGGIGVDCERLLRSVRLCDGDIDFELKNNNIIFVCGNQRYNLITLADLSKFKTLESKGDTVKVKLPVDEVKAYLASSMYLVDESAHYGKKGVTLSVSGGVFRLATLSTNNTTVSYTSGESTGPDASPVILPAGLCKAMAKQEGEFMEIAIGKTVIAIRLPGGVGCWRQMSATPQDPAKMEPMIKQADSKPGALVSAGLFAQCLRNVVVMSDDEERHSGKLSGKKKGELSVYAHTVEAGAAKSKVIIAGDYTGSAWYNLRSLLNYTSKLHPESEVKLTPVMAGQQEALMISHGASLLCVSSMAEQSHDEGVS